MIQYTIDKSPLDAIIIPKSHQILFIKKEKPMRRIMSKIFNNITNKMKIKIIEHFAQEMSKLMNL